MKTNRAKLSAMVKLGQRGALLASALCLGGMAQAQTTYNVAGLADFTGPFADIMKDMTAKDIRMDLKVRISLSAHRSFQLQMYMMH